MEIEVKALIKERIASEERAHEMLCGLVSSILPYGRGLVLMLKLYADESFDDKTSLLHVAGYLMTETQFIALDSAVRDARGDLPYFHMKDNHEVEHPEVYRAMVDTIKPGAVVKGFAVSVYEGEYKEITSEKVNGHRLSYWFGGPYAFALNRLMGMCGEWITEKLQGESHIAYVFEAGHPRQGEADFFFRQLNSPSQEEQRRLLRYASHTFVNGKGPLGSVLQPCDILASNLTKLSRTKQESDALKKLWKVETVHGHWDKPAIARAVRLQTSK
jgi:hypothetical protein